MLYSCDFSEKTGPSPSSGLVSKVQSIIRKSLLLFISQYCEMFELLGRGLHYIIALMGFPGQVAVKRGSKERRRMRSVVTVE